MAPRTLEVLVVVSNAEHSRRLRTILAHYGAVPVLASGLEDARAILGQRPIGLIFCADRLADGSFNDLLLHLREEQSAVPLVVFSRLADWKLYLEVMLAGAADCIAPPLRPTDIQRMVLSASLEHGKQSGDALSAAVGREPSRG